MKGKCKLSKKAYIIIGVSLLVVIILVVTLCCVFLIDHTTDEEYLLRLQNAVNNEYIEYPVSVENKIEILQGDIQTAFYEQKYVIENDNKAILKNSEIIYLDGEIVSSIKEEYVLSDGFIYMTRDENGAIDTYKTEGTILNFSEIVVGEVERIDLKIDAVSFEEMELKREEDIVFIGKAKEEVVNEILGTGYANMTIMAQMSRENVLKKLEVGYDTIDLSTHIKATTNVEKQGSVIIPDWINSL